MMNDESFQVEEAKGPNDLPLQSRTEHCILSSSQGPFPDPKQLAAYEEAAPGSARWILEAAAQAEADRRKSETSRMIAALIACALAMATGSVSLLEGLTYEGLAFSGGGIIGLFLAFLKSSSSQKH